MFSLFTIQKPYNLGAWLFQAFFITDERLRILKVIRKYKPDSIYELAKILHRDAKHVTDDVHYLSELGLVEIEKTKEGRHKTKPVVEYEKILVEIMV